MEEEVKLEENKKEVAGTEPILIIEDQREAKKTPR
jgi:hypothetical protein